MGSPWRFHYSPYSCRALSLGSSIVPRIPAGATGGPSSLGHTVMDSGWAAIPAFGPQAAGCCAEDLQEEECATEYEAGGGDQAGVVTYPRGAETQRRMPRRHFLRPR